jgi:hypothetical protein
MMKGGEIIVMKDDIAEKLDEMADLCEVWKRNRDKGHAPNATRLALLMIVDEISAMESIRSFNDDIDSIAVGLVAKRKL